MKFKLMKYRIHDRVTGSRLVRGYAIDADIPVRLCVRWKSKGWWVIDHYDTGWWINIFCSGDTKLGAAVAGVEKVRRALESGDYDLAIDKWHREMSLRGRK